MPTEYIVESDITIRAVDKPFPEKADVSIELLGIPTQQNLVINLRKPEFVDVIGLENFKDQPVPDDITRRREKTLARLEDWRQKGWQKCIKNMIYSDPQFHYKPD